MRKPSYNLGLIGLCSSLAATAMADESISAERAEQIYNETCVVCHAQGMHSAPMPGVKADWEDRLAYGIEDIYLNAIEGMGGSMPARGMCNDCSDEEMRAVVDFMMKDVL